MEKPSWPSPAATGPVQAYLQADARVGRHGNAKVANPMHCCMDAGTGASGAVHTAGRSLGAHMFWLLTGCAWGLEATLRPDAGLAACKMHAMADERGAAGGYKG